MQEKRHRIQLISDPERWQILFSPIRLEVVEMLRCIGPCTIGELATQLARPADTLYRHIELLQEAGFVLRTGFRKSNRHVEQLVDLTADDFRLAVVNSNGEAENAAVAATAKCVLHAAEVTVAKSAEARSLKFSESDRNLTIQYELGWLTPEAFLEVRKHLEQIKALMDQSKKRREGNLYLLVTVAAPVTRTHQRKKTVKANAKPSRLKKSSRKKDSSD